MPSVKRDNSWLYLVLFIICLQLGLLALDVFSGWNPAKFFNGAASYADDRLALGLFSDIPAVLTFGVAIFWLYWQERTRQRYMRGLTHARTVDLTDAEPIVLPLTIRFSMARYIASILWGMGGAITVPCLVVWLFHLSDFGAVAILIAIVIGACGLLWGCLDFWQQRRLEITEAGVVARYWGRTRYIPWHEARLFVVLLRTRYGEPSMYELSSASTIIRWVAPENDLMTSFNDVKLMRSALATIAERTALALANIG